MADEQVSLEVFAKAVRESKDDGSGIDGIAEKTGLKRGSVNSRLNKLRQLFGKENVPSFQGGGGRKISDERKQAVLSILKPEVQNS
jgi:hypothetical protein